jgi:3-methylfumaryl-CoA hydratase
MSQSPWSDWVGRTETALDIVSPTPARALRATLGGEPASAFAPGAQLPHLWTWLYFLPLAPMSEVGPDGHPKRGGFLPPIDLPRRMWAGSRCEFQGPVRIGDEIQKTSTIVKVSEKAGNAGALVFVTVRHEVRAMGRLAMIEEQDLVYMNTPTEWRPPAATPLPPCAWSEPVDIDPVFLFRFSALTFNGHRIHYDRTYATDIEKYPGLVVHGPAQAVLLFDAATRRDPGRTPASFTFRGNRPLFDFDRITRNGAPRSDDGIDLFTANADGAIGMQASLAWAS